MKTILEIIVIFIASLNLVLTRFALFRLYQPTTLFSWLIKVLASGLSPILFLVGISTVFFGWILSSTPSVAIGGLSSLLYLIHIIRVTGAPDSSTNFEIVFGKDFERKIPQSRFFLPRRYVVFLPNAPNPIVTQNIPYYTIPDSNRQLLCDLWQPPKGINHSGLAFIYLHGSAWAVLDKDYGTRTFFRHLASQGHVIMDVAYRLFPETNFMGMVHDTKHAIAWLKAHASPYGINPQRVVIGGGSAGAHLALLAAYTDKNTKLAPLDLEHIDVSVRGVISLYGQSDLKATYYHTCQHIVTHSGLSQRKGNESGGMPLWIQKNMGNDFHRLGFDKNVEPGMLTPMLGGNPIDKSKAYSLFSPISYVHKGCPPTLFIHGEQDILAPLEAIRVLKSRLVNAGVPVVMHVLPQTDHAFDMIFPKMSPSAQNAFYDVERFLAWLV